ncbi:MAG: hypothetical protein JXR88_01665 [Clostridia bacterium]|nr:hypothetical protein [Clostridia bacterium]
MWKKSMIAIVLMALVISVTMVMFADVAESEEYVYIINPEVGTSGKTIVNESMFISIYVESEQDMLLELVKKPVFTFENEKALMPDDEILEEKFTIFDILSRQTVYSKSDIMNMYQLALYDKEMAKDDLNLAKLSLGSINPKDETYLTLSEQKLVEKYNSALENYNKVIRNYQYWKDSYFKLFEQKIIDNLVMSVDPAFPYFEYTVEDITPGHYVMKVKNSEGIVVESLEFDVVTEDVLTDEILGNTNFFDNILGEEVFE